MSEVAEVIENTYDEGVKLALCAFETADWSQEGCEKGQVLEAVNDPVFQAGAEELLAKSSLKDLGDTAPTANAPKV